MATSKKFGGTLLHAWLRIFPVELFKIAKVPSPFGFNKPTQGVHLCLNSFKASLAASFEGAK